MLSNACLIPSIRNIECSIALFFPSRRRFILNPCEANAVVIYSSKTLFTGSVFVSLDLRAYCRVVCR
jgi:hypothetical protein